MPVALALRVHPDSQPAPSSSVLVLFGTVWTKARPGQGKGALLIHDRLNTTNMATLARLIPGLVIPIQSNPS